MSISSPYPIVRLRRGRDKPVRNRHPWVFSGAIASVDPGAGSGDAVTVVSADGAPLGHGTYSPRSQIQVRLVSWQLEDRLDEAFWEARIASALARRDRLGLTPETTAYRLIAGEADGLPGLIVDRYGPYLVLQSLTTGVEVRKEQFARLLSARLDPAGIWERSDVAVRRKEGLPETTGLLTGEAPPDRLLVRENGLQFPVDVRGGHKTGLYLDQRDNRALLGQPRFVAGKEMLNVFAYTGGFAAYAARAGAASIVNVDSSEPALAQAAETMTLNGLSRPADTYVADDAFELLRVYRDGGRQFDVIVLDPPKFAHSKRDIDKAARGYKDLNWLAMRLLRPGGLLASFSCSGLVSADLFQKILFGAAVDAGVDARILYTLSQAPDHPVALTVPESAYLKGLLLTVDPAT